MTEQQLRQALALSDPAVGQRPGIDDPGENRELWDYGGGDPRVALANDGRLLVTAGGGVVALTPQAVVAAVARLRADLGV